MEVEWSGWNGVEWNGVEVMEWNEMMEWNGMDEDGRWMDGVDGMECVVDDDMAEADKGRQRQQKGLNISFSFLSSSFFLSFFFFFFFFVLARLVSTSPPPK